MSYASFDVICIIWCHMCHWCLMTHMTHMTSKYKVSQFICILYFWIKYICIWCVSKLGSIFRILFPFFESSLQATAISGVFCLGKYGRCWFNYALMALEKILKPTVFAFLRFILACQTDIFRHLFHIETRLCRKNGWGHEQALSMLFQNTPTLYW